MRAISMWERVVLANLALFFILGIILAIWNTPYYDVVYSVEDGVLEWLTFVALGHTAIVSWWRFWSFSRQRQAQGVAQGQGSQPPIIFLVSLFCCGLLFTFGLGEEISWGQRLFNITPGDFFEQHNLQGETNLHNLVVGDHKINKLIFGKGVALFFIIYLLILTPLYWKESKLNPLMDACGVPIPKGYQWLAMLIILIGVEVVIKQFSDTGRRGELTEFSAAIVIMLVVIFPYNRRVFEVPR